MQNQRYPSSNYARILFRHLRLSEDDHRGYFAGTDVTYAELMSLDGTIGRDAFTRIYRNALAISDHADLGLSVGSQLHLSAHGPLGVATYSGPDLRTALILLAKYSQTRTEFFNITLSEHPQGLKVHFAEAFELDDLRVFITESVISGLFAAINFFVGAGQFRGQVYFAYPRPSYGHKYFDHFGEHIKFDCSATEIVFPEAMLATPSLVADPVLHQEAVAMCDQQLKEINAGTDENTASSTQEAVAKLLAENPGRIWTLAEVAAQLHISSRTLIRRLAAEGTKFQTVRDEMAKTQVTRYLTDSSLSVESIGHLMGFSDTSSFRRSFKRWFGETPAQYMAKIRAA